MFALSDAAQPIFTACPKLNFRVHCSLFTVPRELLITPTQHTSQTHLTVFSDNRCDLARFLFRVESQESRVKSRESRVVSVSESDLWTDTRGCGPLARAHPCVIQFRQNSSSSSRHQSATAAILQNRATTSQQAFGHAHSRLVRMAAPWCRLAAISLSPKRSRVQFFYLLES